MGMAYFLGGIIPMIPYFALPNRVTTALFISIGITAFILLVFGYVKTCLTVADNRRAAVWGALQTLAIGAAAAAASYGIVRAIDSSRHGAV